MMSEETQDTNTQVEKTSNLSLDTFIAQKAGMTRIFNEAGNHVPVTVLKIIPNIVTQVKTKEKDGYCSYQIAFNEKREKLINKPKKGVLAKAKSEKNLNSFTEVLVKESDLANLGSSLSMDNFPADTPIDVTGTSKGKGFQGVIKRYNFSGGPAAHGSKFHRTTGSIGNRATPGKVFKGKKMPGHMGDKRKTVQNLTIVEINSEKGYVLVRGSVPGHKNGFIRISKAVKK